MVDSNTSYSLFLLLPLSLFFLRLEQLPIHLMSLVFQGSLRECHVDLRVPQVQLLAYIVGNAPVVLSPPVDLQVLQFRLVIRVV